MIVSCSEREQRMLRVNWHLMGAAFIHVVLWCAFVGVVALIVRACR